MKNSRNSRKIAARKKPSYLTKRVMKVAIGRAIKKASNSTRSSMDYIVKAENGWIIREEKDGTKTKISKIEQTNQPVVLD